MPDREKVINALERCDLYELCVDDSCPYYRDAACLEKLRQDVIALLKEKGPAEPVMKKGRLFTVPTCRKCGYFFPTGTKPNYCSNCGQAVKWE